MGNCEITKRNGTKECKSFNTEYDCLKYGVDNNVTAVWYGSSPCPSFMPQYQYPKGPLTSPSYPYNQFQDVVNVSPCSGIGMPPTHQPTPPYSTQICSPADAKNMIRHFVYFWSSTGTGWVYVWYSDNYNIYGCTLFRDQSGRLSYQPITIPLSTITNWIVDSLSFSSQHYPVYLADCNGNDERINNYYKLYCAGVLLICRDGCVTPGGYHYPVGPEKSCGGCIGIP